MIRYQITPGELQARIDQLVPTWRTKAAERTEAFRQKGSFEEQNSIWSAIKPVFMQLQSNKCGYCERQLSSGRIEHDIDHFRPKRRVKKWPTDDDARSHGLQYAFDTGDDWVEGYYLLAYSVCNYVAACKKCNSEHKKDYFPIYGSRGQQTDDCEALQSEQPLLIYSIGEIDDDPEELIGFVGIIPVPKQTDGYKKYRARITIDLLGLEDRDDLRIDRAWRLQGLWLALRMAKNPSHPDDPDLNAEVRDAIDCYLSPTSPHSSCMRSFYALYQREPDVARQMYEEARKLLKSRVPGNR